MGGRAGGRLSKPCMGKAITQLRGGAPPRHGSWALSPPASPFFACLPPALSTPPARVQGRQQRATSPPAASSNESRTCGPPTPRPASQQRPSGAEGAHGVGQGAAEAGQGRGSWAAGRRRRRRQARRISCRPARRLPPLALGGSPAVLGIDQRLKARLAERLLPCSAPLAHPLSQADEKEARGMAGWASEKAQEVARGVKDKIGSGGC